MTVRTCFFGLVALCLEAAAAEVAGSAIASRTAVIGKSLRFMRVLPFVSIYLLYEGRRSSQQKSHRRIRKNDDARSPEGANAQVIEGAPPGTRTPDPLIKSQLL